MIKLIKQAIYSDTGKKYLKRLMDGVGYDYGHWVRTVMYRECAALIESLGPQQLDVLEISSGNVWQQFSFKSFTEANYPDFDVCSMKLPQQYDLIIADQVFEHLLWPYRAGRNVYDMLKPGGHFLVTTPFMIKVHEVPVDCSRWTELGMKHLLAECGFDMQRMQTGAWGNRACVKGNFNSWARRGWFRSLKNEAEFPVAVWALAEK